MKALTIAHLSDIHWDRQNQSAALLSLGAALDAGSTAGVDLWALSGDLFNRGVQNSDADGFPELVEIIQEMLDVAPIVAVTGTPTHDIPGSYAVLEQIRGTHEFVVLDPRESYFLESDGRLYPNSTPGVYEERLLILGCPEPSRAWLLAGANGMGRDEATAAVQGGMRELLLGLAAQRKQYPDIPCLFLYHGYVEGASLSNGQTLGLGETRIGRDDLAMVGADYIALGHVHAAQQIPGISAYYAGSAYPCDWGETEQKGFNLVTIEEPGVAVVVGHDFPHPRRKKIVWTKAAPDRPVGVGGYQVWEVLKGTEEELAEIDTDSELMFLLGAGALDGSRVTTELIPTETVRAAQITEKRCLRDKVSVYAEASEEAVTESILRCADGLEEEAEACGEAIDGAHIRIRELRLRGAIGIWKGLHVDEVTLDLDSYDPGLITLVGDNGKGKSTLIENLHPYPQMLTRGGKLADHFRLRDSCRELWFSDERTGTHYRALIQIDGTGATGKCDYYLYRIGADGEVPLTTGRKAEYEAEIAKLFGPLPLYLRSAFVAQKPSADAPDLADTTPGARKALFRELGGLDYLQSYSERAKENAGKLEADVATDRARLEAFEPQAAELPEVKRQLVATGTLLRQATDALGGLEARGKAASAKLEAARVEAERERADEEKADEINVRISDLYKQKLSLEARIKQAMGALERKPAAEAAIQRYHDCEREKGAEDAKTLAVAKEREKILGAYHRAREVVAAREKELLAAVHKVATKVADLQAAKKVADARVETLLDQLAERLTCPKCGHTFARDQERLDREFAEAQQGALDTDVDLEAARKAKEEADAEVFALESPEQPKLPAIDESRSRALATEMSSLRVADQQRILSEATAAQAGIEAARKQIEALETADAAAIEELTGIERRHNPQAEDQLSKANAGYEQLRSEYQAQREALAALKRDEEHQRQGIAKLEGVVAECEAIRATVARDAASAAEWRYLERACGPNGIQALELDAMGPEVSRIANELLSAAYGSRFAIEIRTLRLAGKGSKAKWVEDFEIVVHDASDGGEQALDTLSGGESVWIKRSIYDAFGLLRAKSTGLKFLTCFQDETDGQLDPEARLAYVRMLEKAHQESGRDKTILITHSPEAQEMILQRIVMSELAGQATEVVR